MFLNLIGLLGNLIAKHRKVHLFDIDVPGKITFQESKTLSPGNSLTQFETGLSMIYNYIIINCYFLIFQSYNVN